MKIFIPYDFPNWNEYINSERSNKYLANNIKQEEKKIIAFTVKQKYTGEYPVTLTIRPHFKNKRRDLDNYRIKGLIDGLVSAGVIVNDNLKYVNCIVLDPVFSDEAGVEVEITETGERNGKQENV